MKSDLLARATARVDGLLARVDARVRGSAAVTLVQLGALGAATLLFAGLLRLVGAAPGAVLADMVEGAFGSRFSFENSLVRAAPLMLTALCTLLPARMGLVVIGNEGALLAGGLASAALGAALEPVLAPYWLSPLLLLAGALAGALPIALAGVLRERRGVNETISSLLLFYLTLAVFLHLVEGPLRDPTSLNKPSTVVLGEPLRLGTLPGSDVHWGLLLGVLACLLAHVWIEHTRFGFAARVVGGGPRAAQLVGLPVFTLTLSVCGAAGAAAGLAGAIEVLAVHGSANASLYAGYGFAGILVAFVARQHALAVIPVAVLLGGIEASGGLLQRRHDLPDAIVDVFKGLLFLAVLGSEPLAVALRGRAERASSAPAPVILPPLVSSQPASSEIGGKP